MDTAARHRKVRLIVSRGGLDEVHPAMIIANAARMSGIEPMIFFTVDGLDCVTEAKVDHLHVHIVSYPLHLDGGKPELETLCNSRMRRIFSTPLSACIAWSSRSALPTRGCFKSKRTNTCCRLVRRLTAWHRNTS